MFFVRTASDKDLPIVHEILLDSLHATYDKIHGSAKVSQILQEHCSVEKLAEQRHIPNSEFLVADNGEVVGGMAFASQDKKTIKLHQIYVHPKYHGGKTGLHLLIEIENSFLDAETIQLEVEAANQKAVKFFTTFGFKTVEKIDSVEEAGIQIPILVMQKEIVYAED